MFAFLTPVIYYRLREKSNLPAKWLSVMPALEEPDFYTHRQERNVFIHSLTFHINLTQAHTRLT